MRVQDLIELLQMMPKDAEVHFTYQSGDHWRTTVAPKVRSVDMGSVEYSEYHRMPKVSDPDWDAEEDTDNVVLIG